MVLSNVKVNEKNTVGLFVYIWCMMYMNGKCLQLAKMN